MELSLSLNTWKSLFLASLLFRPQIIISLNMCVCSLKSNCKNASLVILEILRPHLCHFAVIYSIVKDYEVLML